MLQHLHRLLRLGAKLDLRRHLRFCSSFRIVAPLLGQVQTAIQKSKALGRDIDQKGPDLTVFDLARGAGVLPFDPHRLVALLQKAGLIHHTNPVLVTELFDNKALQLITRCIRIPLGAIQQPLRFVRPIITDRLRQLPAVLALDRSQQPLHVLGRLLPRFAAGKKVGKSGMKGLKIFSPAFQFFGCHWPPSSQSWRYVSSKAPMTQMRL